MKQSLKLLVTIDPAVNREDYSTVTWGQMSISDIALDIAIQQQRPMSVIPNEMN